MTEWKEYKLGEFAELRRESFIPDASKTLPYIGLEHIEPKALRLNSIGSSTEVTSQKSKFFSGDILYGKLRPYFQKVYSPSFEGVCSTDIYVIKAKKLVDHKFLFYLIATDDFTALANSGSTGTRMPRADWKQLASSTWNIPPLPTQQSIASILSSLDDKIELNNAINKNLEALAQALYKRWFVDFEFPCLPQNYRFSGHVNQASGIIKPEDFDSVMTYSRVGGLPVPDGKSWFVYVLLCSNGSFYKGITNDLYRRFYEHYKGLGADWTRSHKPVKVIHWEAFQSKQDAAKREKELKTGYGRTWLERQYAKIINGSPAPECKLRMAGEMVESELGMIPKGWRVKAFKEVVEKYIDNRGKTPPTTNFGIPLVEVRDLSDSSIFPSLKTQKHVTEDIFSSWFRAYLEPNDVLISTVGTIGRCNIVPENRIFAIAQNVLGIRFKKDILDQKYMFCLMRSKSFVDEVYSRLIVTVQASIKRSDLEKIPVMVPPIGIIKSFSFIVNHNFQLILTNSFENELLVSLRNVLLPKLISGELEINEVLTETKKVL